MQDELAEMMKRKTRENEILMTSSSSFSIGTSTTTTIHVSTATTGRQSIVITG